MQLLFLVLSTLALAVQEAATVTVTLSNTQLPKDTHGSLLQTGELQVFDNHKRDGYWYDCV